MTAGAGTPGARRERLRRAAGGLLVSAGVLLVAFASVSYAHGAMAAERVREEWEATRARAAVAAIRNGSFAAATADGHEPGAPVARLRIPRLGLDEIVVEGVGERELNVGPGHLPGSVLPGEAGNAIISAHRDRHFLALGRLAIGDTVVTELGHQRTTWVIVSRRVVKAGAPALYRASEPTLTLTTCWPIRFFGPAPDRLIVTARPVGDPEPAIAS